MRFHTNLFTKKTKKKKKGKRGRIGIDRSTVTDRETLARSESVKVDRYRERESDRKGEREREREAVTDERNNDTAFCVSNFVLVL